MENLKESIMEYIPIIGVFAIVFTIVLVIGFTMNFTFDKVDCDLLIMSIIQSDIISYYRTYERLYA